jgi:hypothetical protein
MAPARLPAGTRKTALFCARFEPQRFYFKSRQILEDLEITAAVAVINTLTIL